MKWFNKETINTDGVFYGVSFVDRPSDWDNPKSNFTLVAPPDKCLGGKIKCVWVEELSSWAVDELSEWEFDMDESDALMSRELEDIWEAIGITKAPMYIKDKYNYKKVLRESKPE